VINPLWAHRSAMHIFANASKLVRLTSDDEGALDEDLDEETIAELVSVVDLILRDAGTLRRALPYTLHVRRKHEE